MSIIGWKQIYTNTLSAAATSVTISGLTGDTGDFKLEARIVNGYNGAANALLRINNDTGSNYGQQLLYGIGTANGAARGSATSILLTNASMLALADISQASLTIQAKSGYVRSAIGEDATRIVGTSIYAINLSGYSWNNTADEITSLVVLADQTGGLGIGSQITLYARATLTVTLPTVPLEWVTP